MLSLLQVHIQFPKNENIDRLKEFCKSNTLKMYKQEKKHIMQEHKKVTKNFYAP